MRLLPTSALGSIGIAATLGTVGMMALGILSPGIGVVFLVLAAPFVALAIYQWLTDTPEPEIGPEPDRWDELGAQLNRSDGVRTWISLLENQDESLPFDQDRVFQWAKETYELVQAKFPADADKFMGEDYASLGSAYFATAYSVYLDRHGRQSYLESRRDQVQGILDREPQA